eukprot:gene11369-12065_t
MADAEAQGEAAPLIVEQSSTTTLSSPLLERLQLVADKGIKKSGLMYSPGKSWATGIFLIVLSIASLPCFLLRPFSQLNTCYNYSCAGKSWAAGIFLIVLSIAISGITVYTAVVKM